VPTTVWFLRSTTPFCCGVYGVVSWRLTPWSTQCSTKSSELNSPPLSKWNAHNLRPVWASTDAWYCLITSVVESLDFSTLTHMNRLASSTRKMKYQFPLGVVGVIGPQISPWTSSKTSSARNSTWAYLCFRIKHPVHSWSMCSIAGRPSVTPQNSKFWNVTKIH
jgi:hypothetical protein